MKKSSVLSIVILAICLGIYNMVMFLIPFTRDDSFWMAYGVTTFVFVFLLVLGFISFHNAKMVQSKVFGIPIFYFGCIYLLLQLILGFIFVAIPLPLWTNIFLYVLLFAISLIAILTATLTRSLVLDTDKENNSRRDFLEYLKADLLALNDRSNSVKIKTELKVLIDDITYSDIMSDRSLSSIEKTIREKVTVLCSHNDFEDEDSVVTQIIDIKRLLADRNRRSKILKRK